MADRRSTMSGLWSWPELQYRLLQYDWILLSALGLILAVGMVMVFSASFYEGLLRIQPDGMYFFKRQILWLVVSLLAFGFTVIVPYETWKYFSGLLFVICLFALLLVLVFGTQAWGSVRLLFGNSVQPGEFTKLVIILYGSHWLVSKGQRLRDNNTGLLPYGVMIGFVAVLLFLQPDITMAGLVTLTAFMLFYLASGQFRPLIWVALTAVVTVGILFLIYPYLRERIGDFLLSIEDPVNSASWQERNTVRAMVKGGLFGTGIGRGEMKTLWVVLPWTDSIFAVIGEETGLAGSLLVCGLYGTVAVRGVQTALRAPTEFGFMVAVGITFLLVIQVLLHISVVLNLMPVTGITLPFISYGGTSLLMWMASMGILVNIDHAARQREWT